MKTLLILAACLAYVSADCGSLERLKVKSQWAAVYGSGSIMRKNFAEILWGYLFNRYPKVTELLTRVRPDNIYSADFNAHAVRIFGGLDICISLLNDEPTLTSQLTHLRDQHNERGIPHEYFDYFWEALAHAIPRLDSDIHFDFDAWRDCFGVIKAGITKDLTDE